MSRRKNSATVQSTTTRSFRLSERQLVQVVRPRDEPAGESPEVHPGYLRDALEAAECRDLAEHAVAVRLRVAGRGSSPVAAPAGVRAGSSAGRRRRASSCSGLAAQSPSAQTSLVPSTRSVASTSDASAVVEREAELGEQRVGAHAGGPDERSCGHDASRSREHRVRLRRTTRASCRRGSRCRASRGVGRRTRRGGGGSPEGSSARRRRAPSAAARPRSAG